MSTGAPHPLDLRDPRQAGVYRVMQTDIAPLLALAHEQGVALHALDLSDVHDRNGVIARVHAALSFPRDWGHNWDALADGLNDLSWLGEPAPRILLCHGIEQLQACAPTIQATLCDILEEASQRWAAADMAFWTLLGLDRFTPACGNADPGSER